MTIQQFAELGRQFLLGCAGTLCFGLLFGIPRRTYLACAADGAVGWVVYQLAVLLGAGGVAATLLAAVPLTLLARVFAITLKAPVTVFLLCGIFPLVPGAENGVNTLKVAVALAIGISLVLGMPFPRFGQKSSEQLLKSRGEKE